MTSLLGATGICLGSCLLGSLLPMVAEGGDIRASLSVTSDYLWRGYSKSNGHVSVQTNFDYAADENDFGGYAGVWFASVDFDEAYRDHDADLETVLYAGWSRTLTADQHVEIQVSRYLYNHRIAARDPDYSEYLAYWHFRDIVTLEIAYAPQLYVIKTATWNLQANAYYPLSEHSDLSGGVGFFKAANAMGYDTVYWNLGLTWSWQHLAVDMRYIDSHDTNAKRKPDVLPVLLPESASSVVLTVSLGF